MIAIERDKVITDEITQGTLKNYSYNNSGQLFLIFEKLENITVPALKGKKKVKVKFKKGTNKEILISLTADETRNLRKFLNRIEDYR